MNEHRDHELDRLLGEYREDLKSQAPPPDLLARLRAEGRRAQPRPVLAFPSRRAMGGLALAASLLVMVAVFRNQTGHAPEAPSQPASQAEASAPPPPPAASLPSAAAPVPSTAARPEVKAKETPSPRPADLPSMQPLAAPAPSAAYAPPAGPNPVLAESTAKASAELESDKRVETRRAAEAPSLTLVATVVHEVWDPGQVARVTTGSYQRLPDGREVRSVLTPVEAPPVAQNSFGLAAPSQPMGQARRLAAIRDQIADARARIAAPQVTPLGETVLEGFRCVGTRTLDGTRSVERWHSAELGLDLLVRTTDASGAQAVTRYTRIERR